MYSVYRSEGFPNGTFPHCALWDRGLGPDGIGVHVWPPPSPSLTSPGNHLQKPTSTVLVLRPESISYERSGSRTTAIFYDFPAGVFFKYVKKSGCKDICIVQFWQFSGYTCTLSQKGLVQIYPGLILPYFQACSLWEWLVFQYFQDTRSPEWLVFQYF